MSFFPNYSSVVPPGSTYIRRFGANATVGTTYEMIDSVGAATPYMPTTPTTIELVSSSANDTAAGTGVRRVLVTGIDANWSVVEELIVMNGTTPSVSSTTFYRVTKAESATCGTYGGSNLGAITCRASGGGTTFVSIPVGYGQTFTSHFCVPAGFYGYISGATFSIDSGKSVSLLVHARDSANLVTAPYGVTSHVQEFVGVTGVATFNYRAPIVISPCSDVYILGAVSSGTASVSVEYWGWVTPA
jgi:hypothetical protein